MTPKFIPFEEHVLILGENWLEPRAYSDETQRKETTTRKFADVNARGTTKGRGQSRSNRATTFATSFNVERHLSCTMLSSTLLDFFSFFFFFFRDFTSDASTRHSQQHRSYVCFASRWSVRGQGTSARFEYTPCPAVYDLSTCSPPRIVQITPTVDTTGIILKTGSGSSTKRECEQGAALSVKGMRKRMCCNIGNYMIKANFGG